MRFKKAMVSVALWPEDNSDPTVFEVVTEEEDSLFEESEVEFLLLELIYDMLHEFPPIES